MRKCICLFLATVSFASVALAQEANYSFDLDFKEQYSISGGVARSRGWSETRQGLVYLHDQYVEFRGVSISTAICEPRNKGLPKIIAMNVGATQEFKMVDDLFTQVRNASLIVTTHDIPGKSDSFEITATCNWHYAGGGFGSTEIRGIATQK